MSGDGRTGTCPDCEARIWPQSKRCVPCQNRKINRSRFAIFPIENGRRRCNVCLKVKAVSGFWKNRSLKNGLKPTCISCDRTRNRATTVARNKRKYEARRLFIDSHKARSCGDCGGTFPPECMDFDHVRGEKKFGIGGRGNGQTHEALSREIEKCDVVCANCHRIRTRKRGRYWGRPLKLEELHVG